MIMPKWTGSTPKLTMTEAGSACRQITASHVEIEQQQATDVDDQRIYCSLLLDIDKGRRLIFRTPIPASRMVNFGVDPVHFGMIMMLNLGIGLCHPPVGSILFVGCAGREGDVEQVDAAASGRSTA